ncbi:uncharacterized protein [Miscanthus floridulus]|uniref:uncharacterized protein n=1 Tax=Miscanthus floridulus TaxID=154761 RepID=UPI00345A5C28
MVSKLGLDAYRSRPHLPKGSEGVARQAAQKEAADARKKNKAKVAYRKYKKEKEIARHVKAGENYSDVESKLASEDSTDVDDMVFSKEEESLEGLKEMSSRKSCFLRMEHAWVAELEHQLESTRRESQDRAGEVIVVRAEEQCVAERATATERGLEAVKAHQAETEAGLRTSLANPKAVLKKSLETLESERSALVSERNALELARKALESERKARSEVDREVLAL